MKCIYQISCIDSNIDEIYIGSTEDFKERIIKHKTSYNTGSKIKLYEFIRANGGLSNWDITPIEEIDFPISTEELRQYEQGYLDKYKPQLNSNRAYIPEENKKEHDKEYKKKHYENNKEHYKEYKKEWRTNNKEHIKEREKEYREKNKEQISIKNKEKGNCPHCSKEMIKYNIKRHIRRKHPTLV
tara:strand:+ start:354 stop:908 length:555 start_codon:yes stop_codon:yes gene_type:complete